MPETDRQPEGPSTTGGSSSLVFLVALGTFTVSLVAYTADLVTGHDILRTAIINAVAALGLVSWAARDTLTDPESEVDSLGGAVSTAVMLYGLYLLLGSLVVAGTSPWHARLAVALGATGVGIAAIVIGFLGFPRERLLETGDPADTEEAEPTPPDDSSE